MNWYKKSQLQETLPYFKEFEEYGDYVPEEESLNERLMDTYGVSIINDIGQGDSGIAYLLSDGNVLKITTNSQEGQVADYIKNNPNPHIIGYKDVWKEKDLYYIIMEKIDEMVSDNVELTSFFEHLNDLMDRYKCYNPQCAYNLIAKETSIPEDKKNVLLEYLMYLSSVPLKIFDFLNPNNIGIKNGRLIFFDIT